MPDSRQKSENLANVVTRSEIRPGAYYDSIVLMQLQKALAGLTGVVDAGVVMATAANRELLGSTGLLPDDAAAAGADDLLIVVKAHSDTAAAEALAQVEPLLAQRRPSAGQSFRPRSLDSAIKLLPGAGWVLVSVPGRYAAGVADQALDQNRHVFLYSDNVALADEVALKQKARAKGLLLMGPDCGTAIINGVGLGFANRVRRGAIGLVGASGTGLQAITSHIHQSGGGISHAIGTGGRDLAADVGAITALQALDLLRRDPATQVIVMVSKPPAPAVATRLLAAAQASGKPVVVNFIGYPPPARAVNSLYFATTMQATAELAVELAANQGPADGQAVTAVSGQARYLRALFSGGTLAYELLLGLQAFLTPIYANAPFQEQQRLANPLQSQAHTILDLGADDFTQGRLHPMLDNELRLRRLRQEAADPEVGLILLDVVLGEGAHPDPAGELAPVMAELLSTAGRHGRALEIAALVIGTDDDPQNRAGQIEQLSNAGARIFTQVTAAVAYVAARLGRYEAQPAPEIAIESLQKPLAAINVGLESFYESVQVQGATAVHVEWRPPAGGNEKMMALLARLKRPTE
jgi:FdrA protein